MQSRTSCPTLEDGEDAKQTGTGNFPTHRLKNGRKQRFQTLHAGFPQICRQSATVQIVPGKLHCVDTGKEPLCLSAICGIHCQGGHFIYCQTRGKGSIWGCGCFQQRGNGGRAALMSHGPTPQPGGKAALRGQGMGVS